MLPSAYGNCCHMPIYMYGKLWCLRQAFRLTASDCVIYANIRMFIDAFDARNWPEHMQILTYVDIATVPTAMHTYVYIDICMQ